MQSISWARPLWLFGVYVSRLAWQRLAAGRLSWHRLPAGDSGTSSARPRAARRSRRLPHLPSVTWRAARGARGERLLFPLLAQSCRGDAHRPPTRGAAHGAGGFWGQTPFLNGSGAGVCPIHQMTGQRWRGQEEAPGGRASSLEGSWIPVGTRRSAADKAAKMTWRETSQLSSGWLRLYSNAHRIVFTRAYRS